MTSASLTCPLPNIHFLKTPRQHNSSHRVIKPCLFRRTNRNGWNLPLLWSLWSVLQRKQHLQCCFPRAIEADCCLHPWSTYNYTSANIRTVAIQPGTTCGNTVLMCRTVSWQMRVWPCWFGCWCCAQIYIWLKKWQTVAKTLPRKSGGHKQKWKFVNQPAAFLLHSVLTYY